MQSVSPLFNPCMAFFIYFVACTTKSISQVDFLPNQYSLCMLSYFIDYSSTASYQDLDIPKKILVIFKAFF